MKWSTILLGITSFVAAVSARARPFRLQIENSLNTDINGFYVENDNGAAGFDAGGEPVTAYFADTAPFILHITAEDGEDTFFLTPTGATGVEDLSFADFAVSEARFTEFNIRDGYLTYGDVADRFYAFPSSSGTGWVIQWVAEGAIVTFDGFSVDLRVIYSN